MTTSANTLLSTIVLVMLFSLIQNVKCDFPELSTGDNPLGNPPTAKFDATSLPPGTAIIATPNPPNLVVYAATNANDLQNVSNPNVRASSGYYLTAPMYLPPSYVSGNVIYFSEPSGQSINIATKQLVNVTLNNTNPSASGSVVEFEVQYFYINLPSLSNVTVTTLGRVQTCVKSSSSNDVKCASGDNGPLFQSNTVQLSSVNGQVQITITGINAWRGSRGDFSFSASIAQAAEPSYPQVYIGDNQISNYTIFMFDATSFTSQTALIVTPYTPNLVVYAATNANDLQNVSNPNVRASSGYYLTAPMYLPPSYVSGNVIYFTVPSAQSLNIATKQLVNVTLNNTDLSASGSVVEYEAQYFYINLPSLSNVTVTTLGRVQTCVKSSSSNDVKCASGDNGPLFQSNTVQLSSVNGQVQITITGINAWRGSRGDFSFSASIAQLSFPSPPLLSSLDFPISSVTEPTTPSTAPSTAPTTAPSTASSGSSLDCSGGGVVININFQGMLNSLR